SQTTFLSNGKRPEQPDQTTGSDTPSQTTGSQDGNDTASTQTALTGNTDTQSAGTDQTSTGTDSSAAQTTTQTTTSDDDPVASLREPVRPTLGDGGLASSAGTISDSGIGAQTSAADSINTGSGPSATLGSGGGLTGPALNTTPTDTPSRDTTDNTAISSTGSSLQMSDVRDETPLALPRTGSSGGGTSTDATRQPTTTLQSQPETTTQTDPGIGQLALANTNQAPTIRDRMGDTLTVNQGDEVNVRLGSFFDEDPDAILQFEIQGDVPNGLNLVMNQAGVAQMYGVPQEFGDYEIKVAAVDPEGLVSDSIIVALKIASRVENRGLREYVIDYDGGPCFLSRPTELGERLAQIEVFAAMTEVEYVYALDSDFKRDQGFEAQIVMHPITADQCPLISILDQVGEQVLDNSIHIVLERDQLAAGDTVRGKLDGGQNARLFIYDNFGSHQDLSSFIRTAGGEVGFEFPLTATGPQVLVAARPRDGSGIGADVDLNALLGGAQRGEVSLALGFIEMK
ncbi:MAG: hypothetical protein AAGJ28_18840, partial [Pseudomonadota bacterium]